MMVSNDLKRSKSALGVYCTSNGSESYIFYQQHNLGKNADMKRARTLDLQANEFHHYLWGSDGHGGLSARFKQRLSSGDYGKDISLILLQFNVNPLPNWPVMKDVESYRPSEKSIGAWITLDETYFALDDQARQHYICDSAMQRLAVIRDRLKARKLDADIDRLMQDAEPLFVE